MSGHSKWSKIKRQKGAADLKKGNLFTKLGQAITIAVREGGGGNPDMNYVLRLSIDKAKEANMPKDNIQKAIDRGLGKSDQGALEDVTYDAVGAHGLVMLIDCLTDNKNRTLSEIRKILNKTEYSLGSGSLSWQFDTKGKIELEIDKQVDADNFILSIMDIFGVEDVNLINGDNNKRIINVTTKKVKFSKVLDSVKNEGFNIKNAGIIKIPKSKIELEEDAKKRFEEVKSDLEELEDVQKIWTNINLQ